MEERRRSEYGSSASNEYQRIDLGLDRTKDQGGGGRGENERNRIKTKQWVGAVF
jgi:hypothetical protein